MVEQYESIESAVRDGKCESKRTADRATASQQRGHSRNLPSPLSRLQEGAVECVRTRKSLRYQQNKQFTNALGFWKHKETGRRFWHHVSLNVFSRILLPNRHRDDKSKLLYICCFLRLTVPLERWSQAFGNIPSH